MKDIIREYLKGQSIEYFSVLDYKSVREINSYIIEREDFLPRSVIVFLLPYYSGPTENLSVYAASVDYHTVLRRITDGLVSLLSEHYPKSHSRGYGDHSPIDERHAALISGLGMLGDSGLIINEKYGTYVFVGDVVTDVEPELLGACAPGEIIRCSHCGACLSACPTGILRGEGDDCLSAITQRKGELLETEIRLMREYNTVWGCDVCQSVCPHNSEHTLTPVQDFYDKRIQKLTSAEVSKMSKDELRSRAFGWRGRAVVMRNLEKLGY